MPRVNFSDRHKSVKNNTVSSLKLHGHTVIELHNHKSGSRERIEHDNTFTDGIANYLLSSGQFNNSPWAYSTWRSNSLAQNLVGGIFLFDTAISDNNGVYPTMMPAGTKMIANGSYGVSNNGAATEMGSFNTQESSISDNAITMVYDWTTSQGNGEIASVCLTSDVGGYIGYGNSVSNTSAETNKLFSENQVSNSVDIVSGRSDSACVVGEYMYHAKTSVINGTTINLYRKRVMIDSVTLFGTDEDTISLTLPSELQNTNVYAKVGDGLVVVAPYSVGNNKTAKLGVYNISAEEWSTVSFTNTTGGSLSFSSYFHVCKHGAFSQNNFIKFSDGTITALSIPIHVNGCLEVADNIIYVTTFATGSATTYSVYDLSNGTLYRTNGGLATVSGGATGFSKVANNRFVSAYYSSGSNARTYTNIYRTPVYLATVNNLDNVLTKTSSETMKVTYTITREEE